MSFDGYFSFGGTEIINSSRAKAYVDTLIPGFGLVACEPCDDLPHALGDEPYTSPFVDQPDWFDANDPNSWGFCGLYPVEVTGLDDAVRESSVTQLATDGAVMSAPRQSGREILVSALLIGKDEAAVQYGITWLRYATLGTGCRDSEQCTGDHLCYYSACPPMCTDSPDARSTNAHLLRTCEDGTLTTVEESCSLPYERNLYQVTVIDGPRVVQKYDTACGAMWRIEFTMVAGVPWAYSTATHVANSLQTSPSAVVPEISCEAGTTSVRRRNLATNPVPIGNVAGAARGWASPDTGTWSAAADTDVVRLDGDASVRMERLVASALENLATNPGPSGDLDGWGWQYGEFEQVTLALGTDGDGPDGGSYMRVTIDEAKTGGWSGPTYTQDVTAVSGPVTITMMVRSSVAGAIPLRVQALGSDGTVLADAVHPAVPVAAGAWTDVGDVTGQIPSGSVALRIIAQMAPDQILPVGATLDAAQVSATRGSSVLSPVIAHMVFVGQQDRDVASIQVVGGVVYAASVYARASRPAYASLVATFHDATAAPLSTVAGPLQDVPAGQWGRITAALTAPEGAVSVTFEAIVTRGDDGAAGVGDQAWLTNMLVERTAASGVDAYGQFTAASFNVRDKTLDVGGARDWSIRGPVVAAQILASGVSIVGTQEIQRESGSANTDQARELLGWLNSGSGTSGQWAYALGVRHVGFFYDQARIDRISDVTTEPIVASHSYLRPGSARVMAWARFRLLAIDEDFWMIVTQLPPEAEIIDAAHVEAVYRQAGGVISLRAKTLERTAPVLIAGDFSQDKVAQSTFAAQGYNTLQVRAPRITNGQLRSYNAFSTSQSGRQDGRWVDNLLSRTPTIAGAELVVNYPPSGNLPLAEPFASDHFMVTAQVQISPDQRSTGVAPQQASIAELLADEEGDLLDAALDQAEKLLVQVLADDPEPVTAAATGTGLVGSYFDGTFPDTAVVDYAWTSVANESISTMSVTLPAAPLGPIQDPDCAVVPAAPRPPVLDIACLDTPDSWRRYSALVPADAVPVWRDSVPVVTVSTGSLAARQVRIRFYPNPFVYAVQWLEPCDFCGEFVISYMPPNSVMTIDGIRQQATVTGPRGQVQVANHLLYSSVGGPMVWPRLSCGVAYTAVLDVAPEQVQDLAVELCLAARE